MRSALIHRGARDRYLLVPAADRHLYAGHREVPTSFARTILRECFAPGRIEAQEIRRLCGHVGPHAHTRLGRQELLAWVLRGLEGQMSRFVLLEHGEAKPGGGGGGGGNTPPKPPTDDPPLVDPKKAEQLKITVTPKLELECKVVVLDRKLAAHQEASETKLVTGPTAITVWLEQDKPSPQFDRGVVLSTVGAGAVEFFEDEAMTKKLDPSAGIPAAKVLGGAKMTVYAAGRTAGKFTLKATVEAPTKTEFVAAPAAEAAMGVVELKCNVFRWDAANPPASAAMADADKVKVGRFLHVQSADKDHARAKLVVAAVVADQWPAGTDDYEIVLQSEATSGAAELWDAETDGAKVALPLKLKKSALAADKTYWLEGKAETTALRHVRLSLGLGAPAKTPKQNGDWLRVTVVKLDKVAPSDQFAAPSADYNADKHRVKINVKADGHKLKIKAALTQKLKGVPLHFMLAPDKDNGLVGNAGVAVPADLKKADGSAWKWTEIDATLRHKDKKNAADHWHLGAVTDDQGAAECELELSKIGGDVFHAGVYIGQDPHLAKFVHGHATDGKRKPLLSKKITVYRKLWYQIAKAKSCGAPQPGRSEAAYEKVKVELKAGTTKNFEKTDLPAALQSITFYPQWMVVAGGNDTEVAVVGGHNWAHFRTNEATFFPKTDADEVADLKARILVVDHQWDPHPDGYSALKVTTVTTKTSAAITMSGIVVKPPLQGPLIQTAKWQAFKKSDGSVAASGNLADADILITKPRADRKQVQVKLPDAADAFLADAANFEVKVSLKLAIAANYLGESKGRHILAVYDASDVGDYNDTISHEIGHSVGQTPKPTKQPKGMPDHPWWNTGMGTHCANPTTPSTRSPVAYPSGSNAARLAAKCLMFESGPVPSAGNGFCATCHHYILARDMSTL